MQSCPCCGCKVGPGHMSCPRCRNYLSSCESDNMHGMRGVEMGQGIHKSPHLMSSFRGLGAIGALGDHHSLTGPPYGMGIRCFDVV